ncbi:hypothetical protein LOTGIDRAFT_235417 [Lottia gigantea]|uniref:Uncharacterized protein n=1 Tax=Lottia gigantea TaxID=225164 RepID=V3ZPW3_LOTGI|nr:hypothetical protein LOTGIDRAFT_235417 [Lottia gigantea]ESO86367.1 hypothetical protein LOTGIDRAFT_235417 [Lottia gigantea]
MSYYDQWFLTNQQPDSPGKRKREDFYSDGGKYSSDYTEAGGSTGRGGGPGSSYRGGAGGSGRGRGNQSGNRGDHGRGGYGPTNYSDYQHGSTSWQGFSNNKFVSKKQRMLEEIAQLEDDTEELMLQEKLRALREEKKMREMALNKPYLSGSSFMGRGGFGRGRGFGPGMPPRDNFGWGYGAGPSRGRGGQGYHSRRGDGHVNRGRGGPGHRYRKIDKKTDRESEEKKEKELEENNPYEYKLELKEEVDMKGRDQRLLTLMKLIKSFDYRSSPAQTLRHCIRNNNLNIQVYFYKNKSVLFLDKLFIARGTARNQKSDTYTQAIDKLRNLSLDEIKADAEKAGEYNVYPEKRQYPAHSTEEMRKLTTPIEIADFPFRRRLELFCIAVNRHDPNINCTKLYCTKYAMNLRSVYTFHPEEADTRRQHMRIYLCEMFVCEAIGYDRGKCDRQCINNFYETLKTKTIDELIENDGRYSKDVFQPPTSIQFKGVGQQVEDNLCRLASLSSGTLEAIEKNNADDLVLIERKSYDGSWSKILEDSALYNRLKLTYVWDLVHPGGELPEIGTEKKMEFEVEMIKDGRKSGKKGKSSKKADVEEDRVFADTNEIDDVERHKEAVAQRAREYRVMMISCKVFLQDKCVGEGYSIYRRCAQQVAAAITYKNLFSKHTAIYDDGKQENQDYDYADIIKRAEELCQELPKPPAFEDFDQSLSSSDTADLTVERHDNDNDDKSDENDQSDDDADYKLENDEQNKESNKGNNKTIECKTLGKTIFFHDKEEELLPWIREIVKRDLEKLAASDVLSKGYVVYRGYPGHMNRFLRFCSKKYGLDIRSRMDKGKKSGMILTKPIPQAKDMVEKLMEIPDKCCNGYTLEQIRQPDGNLEVYHKLVKQSSLKLPKQKQGVKEEYTTSVQSFKPVLDSYQTSNSSIDTTNSQPGLYRTATTASAFNSNPAANSQPLLSLHRGSKHAQVRSFQRKSEKADSQEDKSKTDNQCFPNQRALQDSVLDFQSNHNFCDNPIPPYRRQPPRLNLHRHSERMPKLPFRRYSSPPVYESCQQDFPDYCDDIQSNYQRRYSDNESSRHHNGSIRYSPLQSRGRSDNILRRHSLRGRHETRPSFSSFEARHDFKCDQDYYETSRWNYRT